MDMEVYVWGKASLLGEVQHVPYLKVRTESLIGFGENWDLHFGLIGI